MLGFTGKTYVPFARACAQASQVGEKRFEAEIYGMAARFSTHHYRAWSFEQVQKRYAALDGTAKAFVDDVFSRCGVLPALMADGIQHCDLFDGFTPPVIKDGVSDARVRHIKSKGKKAGLL